MARQPYHVNSDMKKLEVFGSFGGGMVTQTHPEKLRNDQSTLLENVDIVDGGAVTNRGAYAQTSTNGGAITGNSQGIFHYVRADGSREEIAAIGGRLYRVLANMYTQITITGLTTFQTTRLIDAVQLRDKMYFATGSGLVEYNGSLAFLVIPYTPNGHEALYIGTNGLAANPDTYLTDATGAGNVILGCVPSVRYGVTNERVTFTTFVSKVALDTLEYKFMIKLADELNYKTTRNWGTAKTHNRTFTERGEYSIKVIIRRQGDTTELSEYIIPRFRVNTTPEPNPEPSVNGSNLNQCNRLFIHFDRLFMYGDPSNPDFLYISHLDKFTYFPRTNIIKVTDSLRGSLQTVAQYRDFLVCWTNGTIQLITGNKPSNFEKQPLHTTLGTLHPYSIQVMRNYITFVGNDGGVYVLRSFNYASNDKMNVERVDDDIKHVLETELKSATRVLSAIYNSQYYLYIENGSNRRIYRLYHDRGIWVRDVLPFSFANLKVLNNQLVATSLSTGVVYKLNHSSFRDGTTNVFNMRVVSKNFDFSMPHHRKKMKEYQLLAAILNGTTIAVDLYADENILVTQYLTYDPTQNADVQKLRIRASGRFRYTRADVSITVQNHIQLVGYGFIFKENTPK